MNAQRILRISSVMVIMTMVTGSVLGQVPIAPGDSFDFPSTGGMVTPDMVDGEAVATPNLTSFLPFALAAQNLNDGVPLAGTAFAVSNLSRAKMEVHQINEFTIPDPNGTQHALHAQISGSAFIGGFLYLIGPGSVDSSVTVELIDVTGPEPQMVKSVTLDKRNLTNEMAIALGGQLKIGISVPIPPKFEPGLSVGASIKNPITMELVRTTKSFGLDVLVQRGHTYQVMLKLKAGAKENLIGVLQSSGVFFPDVNGKLLVDPLPPELAAFFSVDTILDFLDTIIPTSELPDIDFDPFNLGLVFPSLFNPGSSFSTSNELFEDAGFPTSLDQLFDLLFAPITEDLILLQGERGVFLKELSVLVQQDELEILSKAIENNRIVLCDIVRLLHTPQGQRESDCENCSDQPGFPYDWPENQNHGRN